MAVLKAKIEIADIESACTTSSYSFQQGIDYSGKPNTTVQAKLIKLTITGEEALNDKWIELAFDSYRRESGYLTLLNGEESTFRRLTFYDAYLVHYELRFDARGQDGKPSLETEIHFSAAVVELDGTRVENHSRLWWEKNQVTRFNALKKPTSLVPSLALRAIPPYSGNIPTVPQAAALADPDTPTVPQAAVLADPGTVIEGLHIVASHRVSEGLPEYVQQDGKTGTVAHTKVNEKIHYGYNSKIDENHPRLDGTKRYSLSLEERREWFVRMKEKGLLPQLRSLADAQFLSHAEAETLIKASKEGKLPKVIEMYVDRVTCNNCRLYLPALAKELGVEKLNIYYHLKDNPGFKQVVIQTIE